MLTAHAIMLAMLPTESSWPSRGIPHEGLTPTGADEVGIESPVRVLGEDRSSYQCSISIGIDGLPYIPDGKTNFTKDS